MPGNTPLITPLTGSAVATVVLLLLHKPPVVIVVPVPLLSGIVNPAHTLVVPVIRDGDGFIVIVATDAQPVTGV